MFFNKFYLKRIKFRWFLKKINQNESILDVF